MDKEKIIQYKVSLIGKYVKFGRGNETNYGRVSSIEGDIANIRGINQKKYGKPEYHYPYQEIRILNHDEVFKLERFSSEVEAL